MKKQKFYKKILITRKRSHLSETTLLQKKIKKYTSVLLFRLYEKTNLETAMVNRSRVLLGIDVLRNDVKRELLHTVLLTVEEILIKLITLSKTNTKVYSSKVILLYLIRTSMRRFILKYYGINIIISSKLINESPYIRSVFSDAHLLIKVTFYALLKPKSPIFKNTFVPVFKKTSDRLLELLFDNLIIQISECISRLLLDNFSLIPDARATLFRLNFLSTRALERFKNNLDWQDRRRCYIKRPLNIYENQYEAWFFTQYGFYRQRIYANRFAQLLTLDTRAIVIINYIEFQDFVICRLEEALVTFADASRYFLTYVIGQIIGLIWKGIIETLKE